MGFHPYLGRNQYLLSHLARFPAMQSFKICCVVLCVAVVASSMDINERAKGKGKKKPSGKGAGGKSGGPGWDTVWKMLGEFEDALMDIKEYYEASSGSEMPSGSGSGMPLVPVLKCHLV